MSFIIQMPRELQGGHQTILTTSDPALAILKAVHRSWSLPLTFRTVLRAFSRLLIDPPDAATANIHSLFLPTTLPCRDLNVPTVFTVPCPHCCCVLTVPMESSLSTESSLHSVSSLSLCPHCPQCLQCPKCPVLSVLIVPSVPACPHYPLSSLSYPQCPHPQCPCCP